MMVVATDAPLTPGTWREWPGGPSWGWPGPARRAATDPGTTSWLSAPRQEVRRPPSRGPRQILDLPNDAMAGLFQATIEATEEAIYNSLLKATDVTGRDGRTAQALPVEEVMEILRKYGVIRE